MRTADGADHLIVATTRPETMLADMAVAVNPADERYASVVGKHIILPITGRRIPIIPDEHADPALGSGCVKITPGHDFNDFEVGKRAGFAAGAMLNMLDAEAAVCQVADGLIPAAFVGLDRFDARKAVVQRLKTEGFLVPHVTEKNGERVEHDAEPRVIQTPFGDRGGVVIEPWLTDQWYVNAAELAKKPIAAVKSGEIDIVPKTWEKTFFNWMENIQPWCVSRQLWWGHRIPAWFGPRLVDGMFEWSPSDNSKNEVFVAESKEALLPVLRAYYGEKWDFIEFVSGNDHFSHAIQLSDPNYRQEFGSRIPLVRDEDVLDTWFSSALWPFATLGWPHDPPRHGEVAARSADGGDSLQAPHDKANPHHRPADGPPPRSGEDLLAKHYPNSLLISGFDILFFWDARMMMMGYYNMGQKPWDTLYLHGLVRAADGAKMSKSKGNVVDPLSVIDEFGADALRFTLMRNVAPSHDIRLGPQDVENNRNFATKLWNAARFVEFNGAARVEGFDPKSAKEVLNRWIAHETQKALAEVTAALGEYKFAEAANAAYRFVWNVYCDWYVELSKPLLTGPDGPAKDETRAMAAWVLDEILKMLHPFMPFITEELWRVTAEQGPKRETLLALAPWPTLEGLTDDKAEAEIGWVIDLITAIRSARSELNVPGAAKIPLFMRTSNRSLEYVRTWREPLTLLARLSDITAQSFDSASLWKSAVRYFSYARWFGDKRQKEFLRHGSLRGAMQVVVRQDVAFMPLAGVIDIDAERARLAKEMKKAEDDIARVEAKLGNPKFVERAAEDVVEEEKAKREEALARKAKIAEAIERLKGAA